MSGRAFEHGAKRHEVSLHPACAHLPDKEVPSDQRAKDVRGWELSSLVRGQRTLRRTLRDAGRLLVPNPNAVRVDDTTKARPHLLKARLGPMCKEQRHGCRKQGVSVLVDSHRGQRLRFRPKSSGLSSGSRSSSSQTTCPYIFVAQRRVSTALYFGRWSDSSIKV
jgi:hypothetical protein